MHDAAVGVANSFKAQTPLYLQSGAWTSGFRKRDTRRIIGYCQASGDVIDVGRLVPSPSPQSLLDRPPTESVYV
jgi:hypothetical protein